MPADWPAIEQIYREGIRTGHATFQTEAEIPSGADWFAGKIPDLIFKAVDAGQTMLGWCALSPVSSRPVYAGVAEFSLYVAAAVRGQGIGEALLRHGIRASEEQGIWTLQGGIFPENEVSIRLHARLGFRVVGVRQRLGRHQGRWRDVVLMERRSDRVGGLTP